MLGKLERLCVYLVLLMVSFGAWGAGVGSKVYIIVLLFLLMVAGRPEGRDLYPFQGPSLHPSPLMEVVEKSPLLLRESKPIDYQYDISKSSHGRASRRMIWHLWLTGVSWEATMVASVPQAVNALTWYRTLES
jgi:hypothetical protein